MTRYGIGLAGIGIALGLALFALVARFLRALLFGVAVTDFEAEAEKLATSAAQLSPDSSKDQVAKLMKDVAELCRELNTRWLEVTQQVFALQDRLLSRCAQAAATARCCIEFIRKFMLNLRRKICMSS